MKAIIVFDLPLLLCWHWLLSGLAQGSTVASVPPLFPQLADAVRDGAVGLHRFQSLLHADSTSYHGDHRLRMDK